MNGWNSRKDTIFFSKKYNKFRKNSITPFTKISNLPISMNFKTETPNNLMKSNVFGNTDIMSFSNNTNHWAKTTLISKAKETTKTSVKVSTVKTRVEWLLMSNLRCKVSSINFKMSTMYSVKNMKKSESNMKEFTRKILITPRKIMTWWWGNNRPETWRHSSKLMLKNFNKKMISSENRNANHLLRNKITFQDKNSIKCSIILAKKSKSTKTNFKNTEWLCNNTNKRQIKIVSNCRKSVKLRWKEKTESDNCKITKTVTQKAAIQITTFLKTKTKILSEDT